MVRRAQRCTAVVGIRRDERKRGLGDGKRSSGERHFRCEPGHAIFASPSQCRLVARAAAGPPPAGKENEAAPAPAAAAAPPPAPPFDLEAELEAVVSGGRQGCATEPRNRLVV